MCLARLTWCLGIVLLPAASAAGSGFLVPPPIEPAPEVQDALDAVFYDYRLYDIDLAAAEAMVRLEGQLALDLEGRSYDLRLERNDLRAPGYTRQLIVDGRAVPGTPTPVSTYRGKVAGDPTSVVRLSVRSDHLGGYIRTASEWLWLEPLAQLVEGADRGRIVAYLDTDVRPDPDAVCGTSHLQQVASDLGLPPVGTAAAAVAGGLPRWELVTEADGEYFQDYGNPGTFDRILDIVNEIDGIYNDEEGLRVTVPFQQAWTNPQTDPYTSNDAFTTLDQFVDWWNDPGNRRNHQRRDMVHMWSGKNFLSGIAGIAYVGVVCRFNGTPSNLTFGISADLSTSHDRTLVGAHEMGHNWSALHDEDVGCGPCFGSGPIMCSFIQSGSNLTFSTCSDTAINNHEAVFGGQCLN